MSLQILYFLLDEFVALPTIRDGGLRNQLLLDHGPSRIFRFSLVKGEIHWF
jgi:hypothetical protein